MAAARALRDAGFVMRLEDQHWLAKATLGEHFVDLIYGMGNGVAQIDKEWIKHSRPGILAAMPVRFAPPEELVWHRLFISERHRHDVADILHLILCLGDTFDWQRLVDRTGPHWPLLLAQVSTFSYVYPGYRSSIPKWVYDHLMDRAKAELSEDSTDVDITNGPLISRFSFTIDVREWGFGDPRNDTVRAARNRPEVQAIAESDVWDERSEERSGPGGSGRGAGRRGLRLTPGWPGYTSRTMFNGLWRPAWLGRGRDPLRAAFGHLERAVMEIVWRGDPLNVREVQSHLPRTVAYTTVMTTLDRLFKKGFVDRVREGRAFVYTAKHSREEVESAVAAGLLTGFLQGNSAARPLLSNLVDVVAERDEALLDELEALVRAKRRAGSGGGQKR